MSHIWDGPGGTALIAEERPDSYGARIFLVDGNSKIHLGSPNANYRAEGAIQRASQIVHKKYAEEPCDCWVCSGGRVYIDEYTADKINDWYGEEVTGIFYESGKKPDSVFSFRV